MDKLSGLQVFVQTAETRSFVAAGRALGISASAVSKSISRLEERVAVRLFQRSTRSIHLTSEGEVFFERCRRIMSEIDVAENELSTLTQVPRGRLKVGLPLAGGLPLPVISGFMEKYPDVELDLDFSDRLSDVIEEGLDAVIRGGEPTDSRLISKRLGSFRLLLVASPGYLAQKGRPSRPADLLEHACLHYRYPTSGKLEPWPLRTSRTGESEIGLPMTLVVSSLEALLHLVGEGRGVACVPDFAVKKSLAAGSLETILDSYMTKSVNFRIFWPSNKQMTPKVRAFVDFVVEHFEKELVRKRPASPP